MLDRKVGISIKQSTKTKLQNHLESFSSYDNAIAFMLNKYKEEWSKICSIISSEIKVESE